MKVDFVLSCGPACRPAYHAKMLGMRKFSSPCDWMMMYSLALFVEVLRTGGKTMFRNAKYDEDNKWVYDADNGMVSMHDFNNEHPLAEQLPGFYEKIERRAKNTAAQIARSRSVGLIMNRAIDSAELVNFAESMSSLFPRCFFYIVNVRDNPLLKSPEEASVAQTEKYTITEISFNDEHPAGREKSTNASFWQGNTEMWKSLLLNHFEVREEKFTKPLVKNTTMNIPIKCFWWGHPCKEFIFNFGDLVNPMLLEYYGLSKYIIPEPDVAKADLLILGSVLQGTVPSKRCIIMGAGILTDMRLNLPDAQVYALRGALTKDRLGITDDVILGDPGLLISRMCPQTTCAGDANKPIGIVPHFKHYASSRLDRFRNNPRYKLINPRCEPALVAQEICSCSSVIASSLHALVFADAYGIPNIRMTFHDGLDDVSDYKYNDYYSAIGRTGEAAISITPEQVHENMKYEVGYLKNIAPVQDALDTMFRQFAERISQLQNRDTLRQRYQKEIEARDFNAIKLLANAEDAECMNLMGDFYAQGKPEFGVEQSADIAFQFYLKAAEAGDKWGMFHAGLCYMDGRGTPMDKQLARQWFEKAAAEDVFWAAHNLAHMGDAKQMNYMGDCYTKGLPEFGISPSDNEAFNWYLKAAEAGDKWGMFHAGLCYMDGRGTPMDKQLARQWFEKAAAEGVFWAAHNLAHMGDAKQMIYMGDCYTKGLPEFGILPSAEEASNWYRKAAEL